MGQVIKKGSREIYEGEETRLRCLVKAFEWYKKTAEYNYDYGQNEQKKMRIFMPMRD
ncbi:8056_t:CDS:2 [Diversispora eburnea]|uniref:8056_t:CDS:1 n=1 Tax=Diversispora eburnea TaxID=1213867 RepID=A0A9N8V0C8_9GLOM|nr:8056_t:CDS:2 [Diversispora eburnea]